MIDIIIINIAMTLNINIYSNTQKQSSCQIGGVKKLHQRSVYMTSVPYSLINNIYYPKVKIVNFTL